MKSNDIPYSLKMTMAILAHNDKAVKGVVQECLSDMGDKLGAFAREYDYSDLPFVIASLKITAKALESVVDDSGRMLAKLIEERTGFITVDMSELKRQMRQEEKMDRKTAVKTIKEIFEADSLGIGGTMSDEQSEAVKMALNALENPECMTCGYCQRFVDEDTEGEGWCEHHDRSANCEDRPCGYYE